MMGVTRCGVMQLAWAYVLEISYIAYIHSQKMVLKDKMYLS